MFALQPKDPSTHGSLHLRLKLMVDRREQKASDYITLRSYVVYSPIVAQNKCCVRLWLLYEVDCYRAWLKRNTASSSSSKSWAFLKEALYKRVITITSRIEELTRIVMYCKSVVQDMSHLWPLRIPRQFCFNSVDYHDFAILGAEEIQRLRVYRYEYVTQHLPKVTKVTGSV